MTETNQAAAAGLTTWREGPAKQAITAFVEPPARFRPKSAWRCGSSTYTTGAERALERADAEGWTVVSVKDDWVTVF